MIEIKVTGSTPLEALSTVTAFGMRCMANTEVRTAADQILAAEQHKNDTVSFLPPEREAANSQSIGNLNPAPAPKSADIADFPPAAAVSAAPAAPVAGAPAPNVPPVPVSPAPAPVAAPTVPTPVPGAPVVPIAPTAPAPSLTLEQVGKAGADLIAANPAKMQELRDLLGQFGVPAITELKPEQVGPFATALRGLGAKI